MILQNEILKIAEREGVTPDTVDKNWVLGHVLAELFRTEWAQKTLVFKGGTCLKKCYFKDYRFSEDLDFTLTDASFEISEKMIAEVYRRISEKTGILFSAKLSDKLSNNRKVGYEILLRFWGANHKRNQQPLQPARWLTSVKMDVVHYETITEPVIYRPLNDDFSDSALLSDVQIPCYDIPEIIAEKFRSLLQRNYSAPRDYYDLWHLLHKDASWDRILRILPDKFRFKGIKFNGYQDFFLEDKLRIVKREWLNSLAGHLPTGKLPDVEMVLAELEQICKEKIRNICNL